MTAKQGTLVAIERLAQLLDLTPRRVQQLSAEGVIPKTVRNRYELEPSIRGYIRFLRRRATGEDAGSETMAANKARLAGTRAQIEEIKRAKLAGEMIPRDQVLQAWTEPAMAMRSHMLSIPSKVAARIGMCKSAVEVQALLRKEIEEALSELSKVNIVIAGSEIIEAPSPDAFGLGDDFENDFPDDETAADSVN